MNFVTAETATKQSIEDALDEAFFAAGVADGYSVMQAAMRGEISKSLDDFAAQYGLTISVLMKGRGRVAVAARKLFVKGLFAKGYTPGEIANALDLSIHTLTGYQQEFKK